MPPTFSSKPTPPLVLSFAASDPTGGAGIQADLLALASMGCPPLSVITALTVQDTAGIDEILVIDAEWVADQARMLLEDVPVAAFKLGMLGGAESMAMIAEILVRLSGHSGHPRPGAGLRTRRRTGHRRHDRRHARPADPADQHSHAQQPRSATAGVVRIGR